MTSPGMVSQMWFTIRVNKKLCLVSEGSKVVEEKSYDVAALLLADLSLGDNTMDLLLYDSQLEAFFALQYDPDKQGFSEIWSMVLGSSLPDSEDVTISRPVVGEFDGDENKI